MKWLNGYRMKMVLVGFAIVILLGGGSVKADFAQDKYFFTDCITETFGEGAFGRV